MGGPLFPRIQPTATAGPGEFPRQNWSEGRPGNEARVSIAFLQCK